MDRLDPALYTIAWIAPLPIEAQAALNVLDNKHTGRFSLGRGDDYVFRGGDINGHNVVIATLPAGQEYGTGSAAALASQLKKFFPNLWFGLLVGVAAGLPNLAKSRDIRLGDVLVGLPVGDAAGIVAYELGKETSGGFQLLQCGRVLANTEPVVRSAIGSIMNDGEDGEAYFKSIFESLRLKKHTNGDFNDPGEEKDILYDTVGADYGSQKPVVRKKREKRTYVWYGTIGSGDKLVKNAAVRNDLRDTYDIIGLEMEAAGTMNRIPVGVIRGVCDYGDEHKNKEWQPYAAAMAASYAKALFRDFGPGEAVDKQAAAQLRVPKNNLLCDLPPKADRFFGREKELSELREVLCARGDQRKGMVLCGISGSGKTQLAREFVDREANSFSAILWIDATSEMSAMQSLDSCARSIRREFMESRSADDSSARDVVMEWLKKTPNQNWLLVLDGLDNMIPHKNLLNLLNQLHSGSTCITTTHHGVSRAMRVKQRLVEQLDPAAARDMVLWHALEADQQPGKDGKCSAQEAARQVSKALHYFPLGIELSGILIREGIVSLSSFPEIFATKYSRLAKFNLSDELRMWSKEETLFGLFETMYESLVTKNAEAGLLLSLCSVYGASQIPISVLTSLELYASEGSPWKQLKDMLRDETEFNMAVYELSRMFLAKKSHASDGTVLSLHLHSSICQWRFNALDKKPDWIMQASYGLARHVQAEENRHGGTAGKTIDSAIRHVYLANRCMSAIEKDVSPADLEAPNGKFADQYFVIASSFANMYSCVSEFYLAKNLFTAAIAYTRTQVGKPPSQQTLLTLFEGLGAACAKIGGWDDAEEALKTALTLAELVCGHLSDDTVRIASQLKSVRRSGEDHANQRRRALAGMGGPKRMALPVADEPPAFSPTQDQPPHLLASSPTTSANSPTVFTTNSPTASEGSIHPNDLIDMEGNTEADLFIGINIGMQYTTVAYINKANGGNEVEVLSNWPGTESSQEIPTLLEYPNAAKDPFSTAKPIAWGFGCNFGTGSGDSRTVSSFIDDIQGPVGMTDYQHMMAQRYCTDYLELLYEALREYFSPIIRNGKEWDSAVVHFHFSVPIHWDTQSVALFKYLVDEAGFGKPKWFRVALPQREHYAIASLTASTCSEDVFRHGDIMIIITGHSYQASLGLCQVGKRGKGYSFDFGKDHYGANVGLQSLAHELFAPRLTQLESQEVLNSSVDETIRYLALIFASLSMRHVFEAVDLDDDDEVFEIPMIRTDNPIDEPSLRVSQGYIEFSGRELREALDSQVQNIKVLDGMVVAVHHENESPRLAAINIDHIVLSGGLMSSAYLQKKFKEYLDSCTDGYMANARLHIASDLQLSICQGLLVDVD